MGSGSSELLEASKNNLKILSNYENTPFLPTIGHDLRMFPLIPLQWYTFGQSSKYLAANTETTKINLVPK